MMRNLLRMTRLAWQPLLVPQMPGVFEMNCSAKNVAEMPQSLLPMGLWPVLTYGLWVALLGLTNFGNWALLWMGLMVIWGLNHALLISRYPFLLVEDVSQSSRMTTIGSVLVLQLGFSGILGLFVALLATVLGLSGLLWWAVIALAVVMPCFATVVALYQQCQRGLHATLLQGIALGIHWLGVILLALLNMVSMAHIAGVVVTGMALALLSGILLLGFVKFDLQDVRRSAQVLLTSWRTERWPWQELLAWAIWVLPVMVLAVGLGTTSAGLMLLGWTLAIGVFQTIQRQAAQASGVSMGFSPLNLSSKALILVFLILLAVLFASWQALPMLWVTLGIAGVGGAVWLAPEVFSGPPQPVDIRSTDVSLKELIKLAALVVLSVALTAVFLSPLRMAAVLVAWLVTFGISRLVLEETPSDSQVKTFSSAG